MQIPIDLYLKRGSILHASDFNYVNHGKFFAVIGVSEDLVAGFFFINSRIHPSIMNKKEQLNLQYLLKAKDYSFLKYDSFLSASNIIRKPKSELIDSVNKGYTMYVDTLKDTDLNNVLEMVRNSKIYNKRDKKDFFY